MNTYNKSWKRFKIWDRWKAVSRSFGCIMIAMNSEAEAARKRVHSAGAIRYTSGESVFSVNRDEYIETLQNPTTMCGMVLQASFGLIEEHARDILRELAVVGFDITPLCPKNRLEVEERILYFPPPNGIEDWGTKLLGIVGRDWNDVKPGLAGIVEVAVTRTALAHGAPIVTQRMANRVRNVGGTLQWDEGETISLSYDLVRIYRDRLRSLARVLADATAAIVIEQPPPATVNRGSRPMRRKKAT